MAVVAAAAAGCGGAPAPAAQTLPPAGGHGSSTGNEQQAEREAARLLSLARVPSGATRLTGAPAHLAEPMSREVVDTIVDRSAYWHVGSGFDETLSWLRAHPPAGLTHAGSSSGGGPDFTTAGDDYDEADTATVIHRQLQIEIAARSDGGTDIRADGLAVWLDPRPLRDAAAGPRMRVTIAGGCPASDRGRVDVTNTRSADLGRALLPSGHPAAALVCTYGGGNDTPPLRLRQRRTLTATQAQRLARAVRAVPIDHPDGGVHSCPMDDGSATVLVFGYPGRPDVDLWWARTGCQALRNGVIVVSGGVPRRLVEPVSR